MVWRVLYWGALHALVEAACPRVGSHGVDASRECCLGLTPPSDVVDDELHKVLVAVAVDDVFGCVCGRFSWPGSLASRPVAFQARPRLCHPVAKPLAGIREIAMPAEQG